MADKLIKDYNDLSKSDQKVIAANAESRGITPQEYLNVRGGLYEGGSYGDVPEYRRLSKEEKTKDVGAINALLTSKKRAAYLANPELIEDPYLRLSFQSGRATIEDVLNAELPGSASVSTRKPEPIGALADGTPIYGFDEKGNPVTSPDKAIYSINSASEAISNYQSGAGPISSTSGTIKTSIGAGPETKEYAERKSAYDLLYNEFKKYGLESLVEGIKGLVQEKIPSTEFSIRLQDTDAYKKRFAANQERIKQGLAALTPAEYIGLENQYQNIMRNYGLPASYWSKDSMGTQSGFNKFIANDVSAAELEDRIATAQKRVINADVNVTNALRQFYPDITNADILAYTLDPTNALENIKRKVTAAEIQGAAVGQGLNKITDTTSEAQVKALEARARELAGLGVTAAQAQQGYGQIAEFLPSATKLGDIYAKQGFGPYNQTTAEQEVFGTAGAAEAARKRKKLAQLEQATFGGSSGQAQGALARDRAGSI